MSIEYARTMMKDTVEMYNLPENPKLIQSWAVMINKFPIEVINKSWDDIVHAIRPGYWPVQSDAEKVLIRNSIAYREKINDEQKTTERKQAEKLDKGDGSEFHRWIALMKKGLTDIKSGAMTKKTFYMEALKLANEFKIPQDMIMKEIEKIEIAENELVRI